MLQDCIFWSFLNHYYVQIVGIVWTSSLPDLVKRNPARTFIELRCVSLQVVTNCSLLVWPKYLRSTLLADGHCWEVSASQRFTARVCDFYGYYSELPSISNSHTHKVSCWRLGLRAHLQARLSVVQFQKEKFDLYQIIVLISLCGVTFWVLQLRSLVDTTILCAMKTLLISTCL